MTTPEEIEHLTPYQKRLMAWHGRMIELGNAMSREDMAELEAWEKENLDGSGAMGTGDWPGWERLGLEPLEVGP